MSASNISIIIYLDLWNSSTMKFSKGTATFPSEKPIISIKKIMKKSASH